MQQLDTLQDHVGAMRSRCDEAQAQLQETNESCRSLLDRAGSLREQRYVLVLSQEGNMQQEGQRGCVGSKDDNLGGSAVEGLGGLVGTLLELAVVAGRLDQVQDFLCDSCCQREVPIQSPRRWCRCWCRRTWDMAASAMGQAADSFWFDILVVMDR